MPRRKQMQTEGFAPVRDGITDHHPDMTFAEIAVFHHLLSRAVRSEALAKRLGCSVGFCPGMTGNRLAAEMGKSRDAVHRALRSLTKHNKANRIFIIRRTDGILINNFDGTTGRVRVVKDPETHVAEVAVKQASPKDGRPGSRPLPAVKQASTGLDPGRELRKVDGIRETTTPPSGGQLTLARESAVTETPKLPPNPFGFVAYWVDANASHDFALRFEPEGGFHDFTHAEGRRMGWARSPPELDAFAKGALEKFMGTFSKRDSKGRSRGKRIGPMRLTEELVAWIRRDLGEQTKRDATRFKSHAERVDESVQRLAERNQEERWQKREIGEEKRSEALSGLLRER